MAGKGRRVMDQVGRRNAHAEDFLDALPVGFPPVREPARLHRAFGVGTQRCGAGHGVFSPVRGGTGVARLGEAIVPDRCTPDTYLIPMRGELSFAPFLEADIDDHVRIARLVPTQRTFRPELSIAYGPFPDRVEIWWRSPTMIPAEPAARYSFHPRPA